MYLFSPNALLFVVLLTGFTTAGGKESSAVDVNGTNCNDTMGTGNLWKAPQAPESLRKVFVSTYSIVGIASLLSNSLIIHGIRVNLHMHTTTNYIILNMACGDILASLVSASYGIYFLYNGRIWSSGTFGRITCKSVFFIQMASMFCSIYSLVAIAIDRFMAVVRPLKYKFSSQWIRYILPLVWLASLATPLQPIVTKFDILTQNGTTYCTVPCKTDGEYEWAIFCLGYCIPHVVMVILYSVIAYKLCARRVPGDRQNPQAGNTVHAHRTAQRATRMMVCTLFAFNLTWGPYFIYSLIFLFSVSSTGAADPLTAYILSLVMNCNGLLNALIYGFFSEQFRMAFRRVLGCNH